MGISPRVLRSHVFPRATLHPVGKPVPVGIFFIGIGSPLLRTHVFPCTTLHPVGKPVPVGIRFLRVGSRCILALKLTRQILNLVEKPIPVRIFGESLLYFLGRDFDGSLFSFRSREGEQHLPRSICLHDT